MSPHEVFIQIGMPIKHDRGEVVSRQGEVDTNLYLIRSGLLKATYIQEDGKESIKSFLKEGDVIGSLTSCVAGEPSSFQLVCLEPSELVRIPYAALNRCIETDPGIASFAIQFLIQLAMKKERREFEFLCLNAEERYRRLARRDPGLLNRVTQNDVARYLGITPVALSRLRRKITSKLNEN